MNTINETTLRSIGASNTGLAKFRKYYPEGVAIIVEPSDAAHVAKLLGASWLASRLLDARRQGVFSSILVRLIDQYEVRRMIALADRNIGIQCCTAYEADRARARYNAQLADAFADLQDKLADSFGQLYCAQVNAQQAI